MSGGVQRAADDDTGPTTSANASEPAAGSYSVSDAELVSRIYPEITARLRAELRRHRDRTGRVNDPGF
jgi:hypothetical protein